MSFGLEEKERLNGIMVCIYRFLFLISDVIWFMFLGFCFCEYYVVMDCILEKLIYFFLCFLLGCLVIVVGNEIKVNEWMKKKKRNNKYREEDSFLNVVIK